MCIIASLYLILKQGLLLPNFWSVLTSGVHLSVSASRLPPPYALVPSEAQTENCSKQKGASRAWREREGGTARHCSPEKRVRPEGDGLPEKRRGFKVARRHPPDSAPPSESHEPRGAAPHSGLRAAVGLKATWRRPPAFAVPPESYGPRAP
jgi:hypothetical protein